MDPFWIANVKRAVAWLHHTYRQHGGLLLTEGDMECQLFWSLSHSEPFLEYGRTQPDGNGPSSGYIHSQVTWYVDDHEKKPRVLMDLTVMNPNQLHVNTNLPTVPLNPNKRFYYDSSAIGIELKFIRDKQSKNVKKSTQDYDKIMQIIASWNLRAFDDNFNDVAFFSVAFFSVVGCKDSEVYSRVVRHINQYLIEKPNLYPNNIFICAFHQDAICWFPNA